MNLKLLLINAFILSGTLQSPTPGKSNTDLDNQIERMIAMAQLEIRESNPPQPIIRPRATQIRPLSRVTIGHKVKQFFSRNNIFKDKRIRNLEKATAELNRIMVEKNNVETEMLDLELMISQNVASFQLSRSVRSEMLMAKTKLNELKIKEMSLALKETQLNSEIMKITKEIEEEHQIQMAKFEADSDNLSSRMAALDPYQDQVDELITEQAELEQLESDRYDFLVNRNAK